MEYSEDGRPAFKGDLDFEIKGFSEYLY